jgi:geranylgeranyl diphosphate synthase type 3
MDLFWRDTLTCPTEADYLEMVHNKTGGLFRLAIKLMQAESTTLRSASAAAADAAASSTAGADRSTFTTSHTPSTPATCIPLINTIGLQFQILDDLLNLSSPTYASRKGHAEDLTEGKFSFPVIHGIRADPSNLVLLNILRQKTTDDEVKRYAVAYMEKVGSFEYTRRCIAELERKAVREIERLEALMGERGKEGGESIREILGKLKAL